MGHESHGILRPRDTNPGDRLDLGQISLGIVWDRFRFGTVWDNLGQPSYGILGAQRTVWDWCPMGVIRHRNNLGP